jgi:hypothetical protein
MLNMLFKNPKIMQMLQVLSNSNNPIAQMDIMFGTNPKYQEFKKQFEGKSEQEIIQYYSNMLGEQGINLNNLVNTARQFGLIK